MKAHDFGHQHKRLPDFLNNFFLSFSCIVLATGSKVCPFLHCYRPFLDT